MGGSDLVVKLYLTLTTLWTVAHQAPLSMGFPRQEYWSRLLVPSPGDLPDPGIESESPALVRIYIYFYTQSCPTHAALSMGFSRQEYWDVLPFPPPGDLPDPRIKPTSLTSPELAGRLFNTNTT